MTHTHDSTTRVRYWADLDAAPSYDARGVTVDGGRPLRSPDAEHPYNLVSSLLTNGMHSPALDVDMAVEVIPSSTEGHFHLYFPDVEVTWERYARLLGALKECGIITNGYYQHCIARRQSTLRPPHVKKTTIPRRRPSRAADLDEPMASGLTPRSLSLMVNTQTHTIPVVLSARRATEFA